MGPLGWFAILTSIPLIIIYFWALYTGRLDKPDE